MTTMAEIEKILERSLEGKRINRKEGERLYQANLFLLGDAASRISARLHPEGYVTFIKDRNINYTNICICQCSFCAFFRQPGDPESFLLTKEEILEKVEEMVAAGGNQVMLQGGLHTGITLEYFEEIFRAIKEQYPQVYLHSLSAPEIHFLSSLSGLSVRDVLLRLKESGLDSLPGGGAEILVDEIRRSVSPGKITADEWFDVMENAHAIGMESTATMVFGFGEGSYERIAHMSRIRELQDRTGGFRAFIPWSFSPGGTKLHDRPPAGGVEYLKTVAIARIFLDNISHIHSGWVTEGVKLAQIALSFGANDVGGLLMEEQVVRATGVDYRLGFNQIIKMIREVGRKPARRDSTYRIVEVYDS